MIENMTNNEYKEITLDEAKKIMLDILIQFDKVCKENNLTYWLTAGTLLGAIRHKGYIPWDDDIDIAMPRKDYEKLIELNFPQELFLQNKYTDKKFNHYWSKLRYQNSLYIEHDELNKKIEYHQGIFIDIFPMNCINKNIISFYSKLQFFINIISSQNRFYNKIFGSVIKTYSIKFLNLFNHENNDICIESIDTADTNIKAVPKQEIFPLEQGIFEGHKFPIPKNSKYYLRVFYGNSFMELPPEDARKIHNYKIFLKNMVANDKK